MGLLRRVVMYKRIAVFFVFLSFLTLQGCTTQQHSSINILEFGLWSSSTKSILREDFTSSLPDEQTVCNYGKTYYYTSTQGLLGDLNFVINVVLQFDDKANYESELSKYTILCQDVIEKTDNTLHYVIQGSSEQATEYLDDKVYDGMFYNFEIVSANLEDHSISYINAHVWDYYSDQILTECLQQIYNIPE